MQVLRRAARGFRQWPRTATAGARTLPDFLVIGAQKAGTTSLYHYLTQYPDVRSASAKEVHFFDHRHDHGERWYRAHFPLAGADRSWVTGEATPFYLLHPSVPERVAALLPEARLVALLRHPVARAYSHFQHSRATGAEPCADFATALDLEAERTDPAWRRLEHGAGRERAVETFSYMRRSTYAPQLHRWLTSFSSESLLVLTAEELFADPATVLARVRGHCGLEPSAMPIDWEKRNARSYDRMPDGLRRRLSAVFAPDVAAVEQLLARPTGWQL